MMRWQETQFKPALRLIALVTAIFFTATNLHGGTGYANPPASPIAAPAPSPSGFLSQVELPDSIAQIKKNFQGSRDKIVIHIQDAHANEEAQRHIAAILDYFA